MPCGPPRRLGGVHDHPRGSGARGPGQASVAGGQRKVPSENPGEEAAVARSVAAEDGAGPNAAGAAGSDCAGSGSAGSVSALWREAAGQRQVPRHRIHHRSGARQVRCAAEFQQGAEDRALVVGVDGVHQVVSPAGLIRSPSR